MALFKYTTKIDADKTAMEIARMLSRAGAQAVLTEYDEDKGYVKAISFRINLNGQMISFKLPCDYEPVLQVLKDDRKVPRALVSREQAVRVAWRIVQAWVEAQLALIETNMVSVVEVFLPYAVAKNGQTVFENMAQNPGLLLGSGE